MRKAIEKTAGGWALLGFNGLPVREVSELCFVADLDHGLAVFPGTEQEASEAVARMCRRCERAKDVLRVVRLGREIDEAEANQMLVTSRLPRRVAMRLAK